MHTTQNKYKITIVSVFACLHPHTPTSPRLNLIAEQRSVQEETTHDDTTKWYTVPAVNTLHKVLP